MKKTILIYAGAGVSNQNKKIYIYFVEGTDERVVFKTKLKCAYTVGNRIECVRKGDSFSGFQILPDLADNKFIARYSAESRANLEELELVHKAKHKPDTHFDNMVSQLCKSVEKLSYSKKRLLAKHVHDLMIAS